MTTQQHALVCTLCVCVSVYVLAYVCMYARPVFPAGRRGRAQCDRFSPRCRGFNPRWCSAIVCKRSATTLRARESRSPGRVYHIVHFMSVHLFFPFPLSDVGGAIGRHSSWVPGTPARTRGIFVADVFFTLHLSMLLYSIAVVCNCLFVVYSSRIAKFATYVFLLLLFVNSRTLLHNFIIMVFIVRLFLISNCKCVHLKNSLAVKII